MFFTKQDRDKLKWLFESVLTLMEWVVSIDSIIKSIAKHMATRQQMDDALARNQKDVEEAITRHEDQFKQLIKEQQDAINNLQSKIYSGYDFSAELAQLDETHNRLQSLAATPIAAVINPPTGQANPTQGAAGHVIGGAEADAAAKAAGGEPPESAGAHAGNTPMPEKAAEETATAPTTTTEEKLEWGAAEHAGMVRDLPDGDWREPTQEEVSGRPSSQEP